MMAKNNTKNLKDKTKKALHRLRAINDEVKKITHQLVEATRKFRNIITDNDNIF